MFCLLLDVYQQVLQSMFISCMPTMRGPSEGVDEQSFIESHTDPGLQYRHDFKGISSLKAFGGSGSGG